MADGYTLFLALCTAIIFYICCRGLPFSWKYILVCLIGLTIIGVNPPVAYHSNIQTIWDIEAISYPPLPPTPNPFF